MQPYQHITAKGNNGAVTLATSNPHEKFMVLGASCLTSVTQDDGLVSSFTVVPEETDEVLALAVVSRDNKINELLLLHITLEGDKASVDLKIPFASSKLAIGQLLFNKGEFCQLLVIQGGKNRLSVPWYPEGQKQLDDQKPVEGESFSDLCKALAEPCHTVRIELPPAK